MTVIQQALFMVDEGVDPAWINVFGTANNDWSYSNAVDSDKNVYLVGLARTGTWGRAWGCLHKFDKDGNFQWGRTIGDASAAHNTWFTSVAVSSDRIAVVGQTLNNPNAANTGNYQDMIVAMYDMNGTLIWQKIYGKVTEWPGQNWSHHDMSNNVLIDSSNNVYICGNQQNQCGSGIGACNANALILKFNSSGTLQWQNKWNAAGEQGNLNTGGGSDRGRTELFRDMAFDSNGDIIVVGQQEDTWDQNDEDYLVMKYNPSNGAVLMEKKVSWGNNEFCNSVTIDSNDNIYCVGGCGTGATNSNKPTISKFNSSMVHQWTKQITSLGHKSFTSVRCDSSDNVYAFFYHENLLTGSSDDDLGIIKFDSSGNVVWQRALGCHAGSDIAFSYNPMTIKGDSFWFSTHGTTGGMGSSDRSISRFPIDGSKTGTYTVASQTWEYDSINVTIVNGSAPTVSSSGLSAYVHDAQVWSSPYTHGSLIHTYTHHLTEV